MDQNLKAFREGIEQFSAADVNIIIDGDRLRNADDPVQEFREMISEQAPEIADQPDFQNNHLEKVLNEMSQKGYLEHGAAFLGQLSTPEHAIFYHAGSSYDNRAEIAALDGGIPLNEVENIPGTDAQWNRLNGVHEGRHHWQQTHAPNMSREEMEIDADREAIRDAIEQGHHDVADTFYHLRENAENIMKRAADTLDNPAIYENFPYKTASELPDPDPRTNTLSDALQTHQESSLNTSPVHFMAEISPDKVRPKINIHSPDPETRLSAVHTEATSEANTFMVSDPTQMPVSQTPQTDTIEPLSQQAALSYSMA